MQNPSVLARQLDETEVGEKPTEEWGGDWGEGASAEIVASCDLSNPTSCESCT